MATLLDLFKSQKKELYGGILGETYIESRGLLNPSRVAALAASSPNQLGDLIGNQIGGALLGSANRPSDTIFRNSQFGKPVSLGKTQEGLKTAVDEKTSYYVKQSPAPASLLASYKQGATTIGGMAINTAINSITKGGLKSLSEKLKQKEGTKAEPYGADYLNGKSEKKFFSTHYRNDNGKLVERTLKEGINWNTGQTKLLEEYNIATKDLSNPEYKNHVITTFELIPNQGDDISKEPFGKVPFVGTITGINEDISPEWDSFRYIGSPFNTYRYKGVERKLTFNLKLYYTTQKERDAMIYKINYLKSLAFPDRNIKTITVADKTNSQYAMAPNLFKVSIGKLYNEISGIIDNLSFNIEDTTPWPVYNDGDAWRPVYNDDNAYMNTNLIFDDMSAQTELKTFTKNKNFNFLYPSIIDISISIRIIETHGIDTNINTKTYRYNFDGYAGKNISEVGRPTKPIDPTKPNPIPTNLTLNGIMQNFNNRIANYKLQN
jgi:hypothetical protein